jgi:hypothetical protein
MNKLLLKPHLFFLRKYKKFSYLRRKMEIYQTTSLKASNKQPRNQKLECILVVVAIINTNIGVNSGILCLHLNTQIVIINTISIDANATSLI